MTSARPDSRRPSRRALLGGIVLALLAAAAPTIAQDAESDPLEGQEIVRIVVIRHNLFDTDKPETSAWPYRAANSLHVVTKEGFIRKALLFEEGDPYSASAAAESARILRSWDFMNPVEITAEQVEGGVQVVVETRDQWTLEVGAQADVAGDRSEHSFTFTEQNFLGRGREVTVEYESTEERDSWTYVFFEPLLLGSRWQARLEHEDYSDGERNLVRAERPFYSLATTRAWGLEWRDQDRAEYLYADGDIAVKGFREADGFRVWGGLLLPRDGDVVRRVTLGWDQREESYADWFRLETGDGYPTPQGMEIAGPRVSYQHVTDRYEVLRGFRAWRVQEDVAMGPNFRVGLTASLPTFGGDRERWLFDADLEIADLNGRWLVLTNAWTSGRYQESGLEDVLIGAQVGATQLGPRGWQTRLLVEATKDLDLDRQLTLGAEDGLRGWDPDTFDGTGRALANIQYRLQLLPDLGNFVTIGAVGFVDAGYTWGARVGRSTGRIRSNVGIGLLAEMTQIGIGELLRAEIAFPDDGSGYVLTVTSSALF